MNRVSPEMLQLHCLSSPGNNSVAGNCTDMTVLERQRARFHIQQQSNYFNGNELNGLFYKPIDSQSGQVSGFPGMMTGAMKPDPDLENGFDLPGLGFGQLANGGISRTASCPMTAAPESSDVKARVGFSPEKISSVAGRESPRKRKADRVQLTKIVQEDNSREKRSRGSSEESDSKITEQNNAKINNNNNNREASGDTSKENSKASEVQKPDYIHVRARRGQATDSHSLAERVRREKISERMKYLQDLVPGCNKITGKAGMLDEIINYVQSLQRQVEFLSMKLATVNPRLDFNIEDLFAKEIFPACTSGIQTLGISETEMTNPGFNLQFNPTQQIVTCGGLEMGLTSQDLALRRTISAPVSVLNQPYMDASSYNHQIQPQLPAWDSELQNIYNVFTSQPFSGSIEACNLKMEM